MEGSGKLDQNGLKANEQSTEVKAFDTQDSRQNSNDINNGYVGAADAQNLTDDGASSVPPTTSLLEKVDSSKITVVDDDSPNVEVSATEGETNHRMAADNLGKETFRVYPKRWFMLCIVSLLNCSNTMSWIAYAPVSNYVDCYYGKSTATWLSTIFLIAAIPVAIVAMWAVRRYGLRLSVLLAAWTNGAGAVVRLFSSSLPSPAARIVVLLGQLLAAVAYPFIMFLPTKVAASWFGDSQRPLATMIAAMSNPLGVLLANLISPQLVVQKSDVLYLNILLSVVPVAAVFLATAGVLTSDPPTPPGLAAAQRALPFGAGMKRCMTSKAFLTLLLALGGGMGMFNALYAMMQQILCSRGYSNSFAGLCCILMIVAGLCGATASAKIVSRTKRFEETMKVSFAVAVIGGVCFSLVALQPDLKWIIAICCTLFGFFGLAAYPTGLEMGAECTYPAAETTSTGLIVLSGQIQGTLYILLMEFMSKPLTNPAALEKEVCSVRRSHGGGDCGPAAVEAKDMTVAMMIFAAVAAGLALMFIVLFKPRLKRTVLETTGKAAPSSRTAKVKDDVQAHVVTSGGPNRIVEMKLVGKRNGNASTPDEPLVADA